MGLNADITVHGWRKPTLYLELVEGGDLIADTKYYVVGVMGFTPSVYVANGSPSSDVYDITTTVTHRSIQISHKTFRDITAFADNGDSRTLITCERHCVTDNIVGSITDIIKIDSGSYAGTWNVDEWVNYDQFIINTSYIDNVPVQFYTDSVTYNQPVVEYQRYYCSGLAYYVSPTDPYATGEFTIAYRWTRFPSGVQNIENPTTITAQPTSRFARYCIISEIARYNKGIYKCLEPYGIPIIEIKGQVTPEDIHDEVQLSGFIYNFGYSASCGDDNNPQLNCLSAIRCHGNSGFTVNGAAVTFITDVNQIYDRSLLIFNDCSISFPVSFSSAYLNFTAEKCVVYNNSKYISFMGWIAGDDTIFYIVPRAAYHNVDVSTQYYINLYTGLPKVYGIVQNKEYRDTGVATLWQNSNNSFQFKNVITYPFYWLFSISQHPDIYMMENSTVRYSGGYVWHFRYYSYTSSNVIEIDYLNVDAPDSNNVKKCIHNSLINITARFYRRIEFYVKDADGVDIEGATIHIIDDDNNEYNTVTNVNGYAYLDCLEQKTVFTTDDSTTTVHDPQFDTHYSDFVIIISKNTYQTYQEIIEKAVTDVVKTIALQALNIQDRVYPEVEIDEEPTTIAIIEVETE